MSRSKSVESIWGEGWLCHTRFMFFQIRTRHFANEAFVVYIYYQNSETPIRLPACLATHTPVHLHTKVFSECSVDTPSLGLLLWLFSETLFVKTLNFFCLNCRELISLSGSCCSKKCMFHEIFCHSWRGCKLWALVLKMKGGLHIETFRI